MHDKIISWLDNTEALDTLKEYITYKSRSNYAEEVRECANYNSKFLENLGMKTELIETSGNPVVFGKKIGTGSKSVLIYGHYDVQHEGDIDLWDSPPFEAEIRGDKIWGRGTADNKGQHFAHIKALEYLKLNYPETYDTITVAVILDGDEERSSFSLPEVFKARKDDLQADIIIVSDGPSLVIDAPTIVGSVRGIVTTQITIKNNPEDLHSGNFGGIARSSSLDMIHLLAAMVDENGRCKIPGFYEDVVEPTDFELDQLKNLEPIYDRMENDRNYTRGPEHSEKSVYELNEFWPTFNINGIQSGGVRKNRRTIIPGEIIVSIDFRLVPNMDGETIKEKIRTFVLDWAKKRRIEANVEMTNESFMEPVRSSLNDPNISIVKEALKYGFQTDPVLVPRLGGSLPLYVFPRFLEKEVFLVPLALPDENNHAPNENLDIPYFQKGVISMVKFYQLLSENA